MKHKIEIYYDEASMIKTVPFKINGKEGVIIHDCLNVGGYDNEEVDIDSNDELTEEEKQAVIEMYLYGGDGDERY